MKKLLLLGLSALLLLAACKKDPEETIIGKWRIEGGDIKLYTNNQLVGTFPVPNNGTTLEFKSDGTCISTEPGSPPEQTTYSVSGSNITIDTETFEMRNLSSSSVTLYQNSVSGSDRTEATLNLKK